MIAKKIPKTQSGYPDGSLWKNPQEIHKWFAEEIPKGILVEISEAIPKVYREESLKESLKEC